MESLFAAAQGPPLQPGGPANLTGTSNFGNKTCACCRKPQSKFCCEECKITDIGQSRVFYCSDKCRKSHHEFHERSCIQQQKVARAVHIVRDLWEEFAKVFFDIPMELVKRQDRVIRLRLKYRNQSQDLRPYTGESMYQNFPEEVLPGRTREDAVKAVLHDSGCQEVLVSGLPLIKILIAAIGPTQEVSIEIKSAALVVRVDGQPKTADHCVLKLTLADGSALALDFSAGQYGWHEILYSWDVYMAHRVQRIEKVHALGFSHDATASLIRQAGFTDSQPERACFNNRRDAIGSLILKLKKHLEMRKLNVPALLCLSDADFRSVQASLIAEGKEAIRHYLQNLQNKNIGRCYWSKGFELRVTITREEAAALEEVWLRKEDMVGSEETLKKKWTKSLNRRIERDILARKLEIARLNEEEGDEQDHEAGKKCK